jgi:dGTPase
VRERVGAVAGHDLRRAVLHELVDLQVADLVAESRATIERLGIDSVGRVRAAFDGLDGGRSVRVISHSATLAAGKKQLEVFLFQRVYRSDRVMAVRAVAQQRLSDLFHWYVAHPDELPARYRTRAADCGVPRSTADYIAGMTDRFLEWDHGRRL